MKSLLKRVLWVSLAILPACFFGGAVLFAEGEESRPALLPGEGPILYVVRHPYQSKYHAIDTLFNSDEFNCDFQRPHRDFFSPQGALKLWFPEDGRRVTLIETPQGVIRDPDVDFDALRLVVALRENAETDYHLWSVELVEGKTFADLTEEPLVDFSTHVRHHPLLTLKKLTFIPNVADFDPIWLSDGSIVFASTRDPKYNMCSRDIASDLYRMNSDGSNIYQLTRGTLFEHNPTLMPDGRILYHRWEYVDRNFGDAHSLWTVNPDGTNQSIYWGNNTTVPAAVYNPFFLNETGEVLCIFGPHHFLENGALAILDRREGIDGLSGTVWLRPESFRDKIRTDGPFDCDTTAVAVGEKYEDPFGLDADRFLVSRQREPNGEAALFLVDRDQREVELLCEAPGIYDPILIRSRQRPVLPAIKRDFEQNDGFCYVMNVYEGTHMKNVAPGTVKYLRVIESPPKRNFSCGAWNGQGYTAPGMNWHSLENKRILGTVEVEEDGSVGFRVPCDTFIYFQLLDENHRMIQTMRSGTVLQSNETVSCVGCHEDRLETTAIEPGRLPLASSKPPQTLRPWYGEPREFGFMAEVQPVLNRHCVECHDYGKPAGEKLNLAPDRDLVFNTAYVSLWKSPYIRCIGGGPAELLNTGTWGAAASSLIQELDNPKIAEHRQYDFHAKMSKEDWDRLTTWLDLNGVYYPYYESAYPQSRTGRTPLTREEWKRLGELAQVDPESWAFHENRPDPVVSFDRPLLSPILTQIDSRLATERNLSADEISSTPEHREALEIIERGKSRLAEKPRADMPGFVPCEKDLQRLEKAKKLRENELRCRRALGDGEKVFDPQ